MINCTGARLRKHVAVLLILLGLALSVVAAIAPAGDAAASERRPTVSGLISAAVRISPPLARLEAGLRMVPRGSVLTGEGRLRPATDLPGRRPRFLGALARLPKREPRARRRAGRGLRPGRHYPQLDPVLRAGERRSRDLPRRLRRGQLGDPPGRLDGRRPGSRKERPPSGARTGHGPVRFGTDVMVGTGIGGEEWWRISPERRASPAGAANRRLTKTR